MKTSYPPAQPVPDTMHRGAQQLRRVVRPALALTVSALAVIAVLPPASAAAQAAAAPALDRRPDAAAPRWSLGLGVVSAPRPYVGATNEILVIPIVELSSGRWFVQGIRAGYRIAETPRTRLVAQARFRFSGLDPGDSPFLAGMARRRETVEAGLGFDWTVASALGGPVQLELRAFADALNRSGGTEASAGLAWRKALAGGRVLFSPSIGLAFQNEAAVDYYYGVRPEEARPGRPAYPGRAAFSSRASAFLAWRFSGRWSLTAAVSLEAFGDEITASPIVDRQNQTFVLLGVAYGF